MSAAHNSMPAVTESHSGATLPPILARLQVWFAGALAKYRTMETLSQMSDRELADIGVNRTDIDAIASGRKTN